MLSQFRNFLILLTVSLLTISALSCTAIAEDDEDYSPVYSLGSDNSDWWTVYPDLNANSGSDVEHPDWVMEALEDGPLLILVHSSNCVPCLTHTPRITDAVKDHKDDLQYYDILAEGSGLKKAVDILNVYNPTGKKQYIPTTIFITLIEGSEGEVDVGWHSEVDIMSRDEINGYVEDSAYYYEQNADNWEQ